MRHNVLVEITLKAGISDPQGQTVERTLPALGFEGVTNVRIGKAVRLSIEAPSEAAAREAVESMCAQFLTNPVIEDARILVGDDAGSLVS
jgi:phosphoribosylformylglycinamidine synthase